MKKVWPIALAATAIFFTAGAALAPAGSWLSGMGWGKVASTLVTKVGIKGTLGKVLTGSIAGSGWGAAIGGGISAATGGSFTEGARSGALSGAITGGLAGAAGWTPGGAESQSGGVSSAGAGAEAVGEAAISQDATPTGGGNPNSLIDFLKNPVVAGNLISGVGKGIGTAAAARTQADMATAERQAFDDRLAQLSDNYRVSREALGLPPLEQQVATPSLAETAVPDVAATGAAIPQLAGGARIGSRVNAGPSRQRRIAAGSCRSAAGDESASAGSARGRSARPARNAHSRSAAAHRWSRCRRAPAGALLRHGLPADLRRQDAAQQQGGPQQAQGPGGPVDALAHTAAAVGSRVAEAGGAKDGAVVFMGTMDVLGELASVAAAAGLYDYSQEEIDSAAPRAAELLYGKTAKLGIWNQQEIEQEFAGLLEANADGSLERNLAEVAAVAGQQGQPGQGAAPMPPAGRGIVS